MAGEIDPNQEDAPLASSSTGLPVNIAATIASALPLVGGVLFLVLERTSTFVRFFAMQSVFFGIATVVVAAALEMMIELFRHIPLLGSIMLVFVLLLKFAFGLAWLIVWLITILKAFLGVEWEIPYIGPVARKQVKRRTV